MTSQNMKLLYAGIAIALLISVLAPFLASPDPDGLESAAESVIDEERFAELEEAEPAIESPMPDYSIEGQGKLGEVVAISIGTIGILAISFGLGKLLKSNKSN
ncbi:PDGLE domain-containing protein [Methanococcoides methylutens]|uniref:PDGLE domain-containing protein n=1 Tax=Methanococcoides methylutens TaxID=2226 RepID=UPI004044BEAA